jgi:hypothetical protein
VILTGEHTPTCTRDRRRELQQPRQSCRLRIFVYENLLPNLTAVLQYGRWYGNSTESTGCGNCLVQSCEYSSFSTNNARQYSSEIPVLLRLLTACRVTRNPGSADLFVVPVPLGTIGSSAWDKRVPVERRNESRELSRSIQRRIKPTSHTRPPAGPHSPPRTCDHSALVFAPLPVLFREEKAVTPHRLLASLEHLDSETARRHLFLHSVDSDWVGIAAGSSSAATLAHEAMMLHLGDDFHSGRPWWSRPPSEARHVLNVAIT